MPYLMKRVVDIYMPENTVLTQDLIKLILEISGIVRFGKKFVTFEINL